MTDTDKIRENRLRRMAERQRLVLQKSRRRDPKAWDYETYQLVDPNTNTVVFKDLTGLGYGLSLDAIEEFLTGDGQAKSHAVRVGRQREFGLQALKR